jgi:hypothetical protein
MKKSFIMAMPETRASDFNTNHISLAHKSTSNHPPRGTLATAQSRLLVGA